MTSTTSRLTVRPITREEHLAFVRRWPRANYTQTPAWGDVKTEWRSESLGWFDGAGEQVASALVLHRPLPVVGRTLAYLPEGPVVSWDAVIAQGRAGVQTLLEPLIAHLRAGGAFAVRMGPPVTHRQWEAATIKKATAEGQVTRLSDVEPDWVGPTATELMEHLRALGWQAPDLEAEGFAAGQPQHTFRVDLEGKDEDAVLKGMNQQWRRNIKKAGKAGVEVQVVDGSDPAQLAEGLERFHTLSVETAERDRFRTRPLAYFERLHHQLAAEDPERVRLYEAWHEGHLCAAAIHVRVGDHDWYLYGASSSTKREVNGMHALQWRMIQDGLAHGAKYYDLGGITNNVDKGDSHHGLLQFKQGTGGHAAESVGEWDYPISRVLHRAFLEYMKRRA